jgi:hypothetical protein
MKPIITSLIAAATLAISTIAAYAELTQFYQRELGQWTIEGYRGDKNFCSAKTYWPNGSYASLFIIKGSDELSLYLHNKEWNISDPAGAYKEYQATIHFTGSTGMDSGTITYELVDNQTVVLRNVNDKFLDNWVRFRTMEIVMPGNIGRMTMGLTGTRDLVPAFVDCVEYLNGKKQGTNL